MKIFIATLILITALNTYAQYFDDNEKLSSIGSFTLKLKQNVLIPAQVSNVYIGSRPARCRIEVDKQDYRRIIYKDAILVVDKVNRREYTSDGKLLFVNSALNISNKSSVKAIICIRKDFFDDRRVEITFREFEEMTDSIFHIDLDAPVELE